MLDDPRVDYALVKLRGKELKFELDLNAMIDWEIDRGERITDVLAKMDFSKIDAARSDGGMNAGVELFVEVLRQFGFRDLRALLWAGLKVHQPELKLEDAGRLVNLNNLSELGQLMPEILRKAWPTPAAGEAGPAGPFAPSAGESSRPSPTSGSESLERSSTDSLPAVSGT